MGVLEAFHKKSSMGLFYVWVHNFDLRKDMAYFTPMMSKKTSGNHIFCCFLLTMYRFPCVLKPSRPNLIIKIGNRVTFLIL